MIKIDKNNKTATATFATGKYATISVGHRNSELILQTLASDKLSLRKPLADSDVNDNPKIVMQFHREESVDAMIEVLNRIKKHMQRQNGTWALAC